MFVKDGMNEVEIKKYEAIIEAILFTMGEAVEVDKIAYAIGHDVETTNSPGGMLNGFPQSLTICRQ